MIRMIRAATLGTILAVAHYATGAEQQTVQVYKSPSCSCCQKWVERMTSSGFKVEVSNVADVAPMKRDLGVPPAASSCHTAVVGGYFIEGHVPPEDISRLLAERPKDVIGLAVPGMPVGPPGMEGATAQPYSVFAVRKNGKLEVFADHKPSR
jgi:hypothetical protein